MNHLIIIMGVSGCGKSTVAAEIAEHFDMYWLEADDFHSEAAKQKMAMGNALTDEDRQPWIRRLCDGVIAAQQNVVMSYSGLRYQHRQTFLKLGFKTLFILLEGDYREIHNRLKQRQGHFMAADLLDSQMASLQPFRTDEPALTFNISETDLNTKILTTLDRYLAQQET